jgi:Zn-finger nucleic acid-binding protein
MNAAAMSCPVCKVALVMSDRQGVEIDYCPQCRGVWLDRGELDKIIERSAQDFAAPPPRSAPPTSGRDYDREHRSGGHPRRRKSFLEELFD